MSDNTGEPFSIDTREAAVDDLRQRLATARFPAPAPGPRWSYGTDAEYLQDLCRFRKDDYEWRIHEAFLNRFPSTGQ